ncbi:MAG: cysteine desulfurase NifS [Acidobacteria bacterium]|nr:MAG: cysteine desulfurase NifS [Acidobacteriota bacterium]
MFRRVYLDNAATTPIDPEVVDAMMPYLTNKFGNASSIHFFGQETRAAVDKARQQVASLIKCRPAELIFTSGGTEANNLAIRGLIEAQQTSNGHTLHIITSAIEHPSVSNVCEDLEKHGVRVTYLPAYESGVIRVSDVEAAISDDTVLISVMAANNEIGTLQPVAEIGKIVKTLRGEGRKIWFHVDAVQAAGKIPLDVEEIQCDLMSVSAHKIYAPKGVGVLFIRRGTRLHQQNVGGRQERGVRGGTESVPLIVAFGKAAELAEERLKEDPQRLGKLRDALEDRVFEQINDAVLNGERETRLPNVSNISFSGVEGEGLLINLDLQGIAVSTGSACSSGSLEPSPVIRALGRNDDLARSAIRFSLGRENSMEDIDRLLEVLPASVENLRRLSPDKK